VTSIRPSDHVPGRYPAWEAQGERGSRRVRHLAATIACLAVLAAGCTGDDESSTEASSPVTEAGPRTVFDPQAVATAEIEGPITGGAGQAILGPPGFDLATVGYVETEFFLSGSATSYTSDGPLSSDGTWSVRPGGSADYTTRVVVRRPIDSTDFNGTVAVEWHNVSGGLDASPDWTYVHNELIRSGWAWVGVSAQRAGIEGGGNPLGEVLALKNADAARYAALRHPGDSFSYDIFSQAAAAARTQGDVLLDGLAADRVIAFGESQSAFRLTTYINAIAPVTRAFDGYLVHSRASSAAPLSQEPQPAIDAPDPTLLRTDQAVPVIVFSSESDLVGERLGYARARQPDTEWIRGWEVAGTAHADAYNLGIGDGDDGSGEGDRLLFEAMQAPPSEVYGGVISCDLPINTGPQTYVLRAAVAALDSWIRTGEPPSEQPRLELSDDGASYELDVNGNARGGIRTPHVDVPVARLSGLGQTGGGFCRLFGTTVPFAADALRDAYPDQAAFVERWNSAVDAALETGVLLAPDAERLRSVAAASTVVQSS
jgi:hypothetical protein